MSDQQENKPAPDRPPGLLIRTADEPGRGGANYAFKIEGFNTAKNPSAGDGMIHDYQTDLKIYFQNGPIAEVGINGVSDEALLIVVANRLLNFQQGLHACEENEIALQCLDTAIAALNGRGAVAVPQEERRIILLNS